MKPYTNPQIRKANDDKWYIEFHYSVPAALTEFYDRGTKRFKKYGDINRYSGKERDTNAEELSQDWLFALKHLDYNPFERELEQLAYVQEMEALLVEKEKEKIQEVKTAPNEEEIRKTVTSKFRTSHLSGYFGDSVRPFRPKLTLYFASNWPAQVLNRFFHR